MDADTLANGSQHAEPASATAQSSHATAQPPTQFLAATQRLAASEKNTSHKDAIGSFAMVNNIGERTMDDGESHSAVEDASKPTTKHYCYRHVPPSSSDAAATQRQALDLERRLITDVFDTQMRSDIASAWNTFDRLPAAARTLFIDGVLHRSCFSQLSHVSSALEPLLRIDFLANLPSEIAHRILKYLDFRTLCQAAQVSRTWNRLADDDVVWHTLCEQHIDRKCRTCGWGLPLLVDRNTHRPLNVPPALSFGSTQHISSMHGFSSTTDFTPQSAPRSLVQQAMQQSARQNEQQQQQRLQQQQQQQQQQQMVQISPEMEMTDPDWESSEIRRRQRWQQQQPVRQLPPGSLPDVPTLPLGAGNTSPTLDNEIPGTIPNPEVTTAGDITVSDTVIMQTGGQSSSDVPALSTNGSGSGISSSSSVDGDVPRLHKRPRSSSAPEEKFSSSLRDKKKKTEVDSLEVKPASGIRVPPPPRYRSWKDIFAERQVIERNWRKRVCQPRELRGHTDSVMCLQYDQAKGIIVSGSYDYTVRVWDAITGECKNVLKGHTRCVRGVQFDDNKIISASMDRTLRVWNMHTMQCIRVLEGHQSGVVCLHFRDKQLASGSVDGTIKIWDLAQGLCFSLFGGSRWINKVQLLDSDRLISCTDDATVRLHSISRREVLRTFSGHVAQIQSFKILLTDDHARDRFATEETISDTDDSIRARKRSQSMASKLPPRNQLETRRDIIAAAQENVARILRGDNADGSSTTDVIGLQQTPINVQSSSSNDYLSSINGLMVTGALDNTLKIWDLNTGECKKTLFGHLEGVWCVDADSLRIVSGSQDKKLHVWDAESGEFMYMLSGHQGAVMCCQLTDTQVVSGGEDALIRIWDFGWVDTKTT